MRSDTEMLDWILLVTGIKSGIPPVLTPEAEAVDAAIRMGFRGREAISAAMGAVRVEPGQPLPPMTGVDLIAAERQRQLEVLGYDYERDATYAGGELASAASAYAYAVADELHPRSQDAGGYDGHPPVMWPWPKKSWKFDRKNLIRAAVKAGGLIAAEIDRLRTLPKPTIVSDADLEADGDHDQGAQ